MKGKKSLFLTACLCMTIGITACGGEGGQKTANQNSASGGEALTAETTKAPQLQMEAPAKAEDNKTTGGKPADENGGVKKAASKKPVSKKTASKKKSKTYKASKVMKAALKGMELPSMMDMTDDMLADTYGINKKLLSSYSVKMPMMITHATECSVFVVKKKASVKQVKKGIEKRVKALEETWSQYLPDQYELVQNYKVVVKGKCVLFVIAEDADAIVKNFKAYVK